MFTWELGSRKKIPRAIGMSDLPLFWGGAIHTHTACHAGRESQLPYIQNAHKASGEPSYCVTKGNSVHAGPRKVMGILLIRSILKAMGMLLIGPCEGA